MAPCPAGPGAAVVCNKQVEKFLHDRRLDVHKSKIGRSRSTINNCWSEREEVRLQASRRNAKRHQVVGDRYSGIEKENFRLLQKMQEIDHRGAAPSKGKPDAKSRCASLPPVGVGSRIGARIQEARRIDQENQRLLKNMKAAKPSVNLRKLSEEHNSQQAIMQMRRNAAAPVGVGRTPSLTRLPRALPPLPTAAVIQQREFDAEYSKLADLKERLKLKADELDERSKEERLDYLEASGQLNSARSLLGMDTEGHATAAPPLSNYEEPTDDDMTMAGLDRLMARGTGGPGDQVDGEEEEDPETLVDKTEREAATDAFREAQSIVPERGFGGLGDGHVCDREDSNDLLDYKNVIASTHGGACQDLSKQELEEDLDALDTKAVKEAAAEALRQAQLIVPDLEFTGFGGADLLEYDNVVACGNHGD